MQDVYVLNLWVDIYVTLFLYACSDQTSMLWHVWECVHYLEQSCSEFREVTKISRLLWLLPFYGTSLGRKNYLAQTFSRMPCLQGCICIFNIMLQFLMQYCVDSYIWYEVDSLIKGVLASWSFTLALWYLVSLHALSLLFIFHYHHVYEKGRSSETMILGPVFSHKKVL
jgi:hypothetical protein